MPFATRGVVEGFYGVPWTHADRLDTISFLAGVGMNAYMYAPKDDLLHRDQWRVAYDEPELGRFTELAACGQRHGVRFGFAISPGLDISYESPEDRTALFEKCAALQRCGVDWFLLALDDIPMLDGLAPRQAVLANDLLASLRSVDPDATLVLCPTEYLGTTTSSYTNELVSRLDTDIAMMWTGPTVCSPTITTADATTWRSAFPQHDLIVWDNYPVNDGAMASRLHLGPYAGRSNDLDTKVQGILCNPMNQTHASRIALATAAEYMNAPAQYDPDLAWPAAIERSAGNDAEPFADLARACIDGPTVDPGESRIAHLVRDLIAAYGSSNFTSVLDQIADLFRSARDAAALLTNSTSTIAHESRPWTACLANEASAGHAAVKVLRIASRQPLDALALMGATFGLTFLWSQARRSEHVVFGPRFATYPAIIMHHSGQPVFSATLGVIEDRNAIDALCRFALKVNDEAATS